MSVQLYVDDRKLQRALSTYAMRRNKNDAEVVNKAMRYVLPFAAKRVKNARYRTGPSKIRHELTGKSGRIGRARKDADALANTVAAMIVASRLRKRGQITLPVRADADKIDKQRINTFYDKVRKLVNARARSSQFLRAGFIPAYKQFNVPGQTVAGQRHWKGVSKGIKAEFSPSHIAEAYAKNAREGAFKIAPYAFHEAVRDVTRLFTGWMRKGVMDDAKRSGFF
jgi:hypothetical protein